MGMKTHKYGTRNKYLPYVPKAKTCMYLESIFCKGPSHFAQLLTEIKEIKDYYAFVSKCKKRLLTDV